MRATGAAALRADWPRPTVSSRVHARHHLGLSAASICNVSSIGPVYPLQAIELTRHRPAKTLRIWVSLRCGPTAQSLSGAVGLQFASFLSASRRQGHAANSAKPTECWPAERIVWSAELLRRSPVQVTGALL
jgi:hypothetical protein